MFNVIDILTPSFRMTFLKFSMAVITAMLLASQLSLNILKSQNPSIALFTGFSVLPNNTTLGYVGVIILLSPIPLILIAVVSLGSIRYIVMRVDAFLTLCFQSITTYFVFMEVFKGSRLFQVAFRANLGSGKPRLFSTLAILTDALPTPIRGCITIFIEILKRFDYLALRTKLMPFWNLTSRMFFSPLLIKAILTGRIPSISSTSIMAIMATKKFSSEGLQFLALRASFVAFWDNLFGFCCRGAGFTLIYQSIACSTVSLEKLRGSGILFPTPITFLARGIIKGYNSSHSSHPLSQGDCLGVEGVSSTLFSAYFTSQLYHEAACEVNSGGVSW